MCEIYYIEVVNKTKVMISPHEKQDKLIRATDIEALSCRNNANKKSYFPIYDPYIDSLIQSYNQYLKFCVGYSSSSAGRTLRSVFQEQKFPLINRGTYFRVELINILLNEFILQFQRCQFVLLGSGSDTRAFYILSKNPHVKYIELDFPESLRIKKLSILSQESLRNITQINEFQKSEISSKDQFFALDPDLHTPNYHLIGCDLRELRTESVSQRVLNCLDRTLPTLVLSECVLCYLDPIDNTNIINFWKDNLSESSFVCFVIYEPMCLNDPFGRVMKENLAHRGLNLITFSEFPDPISRFNFLTKECCLVNVKVTNMSAIAGYSGSLQNSWFLESESMRINNLELVDEIEEIKLLLDHYTVCYGEYSSKNITLKNISQWNWILK